MSWRIFTLICQEAASVVGATASVDTGNRFANELGRRCRVTGETWKNKPPEEAHHSARELVAYKFQVQLHAECIDSESLPGATICGRNHHVYPSAWPHDGATRLEPTMSNYLWPKSPCLQVQCVLSRVSRCHFAGGCPRRRGDDQDKAHHSPCELVAHRFQVQNRLPASHDGAHHSVAGSCTGETDQTVSCGRLPTQWASVCDRRDTRSHPVVTDASFDRAACTDELMEVSVCNEAPCATPGPCKRYTKGPKQDKY